MMNAEMASDTSKSRAHTATTGSGCAPGSFPAAGAGGRGISTSAIVPLFYPTICYCQNRRAARTNNARTQCKSGSVERMTDYSIFPKINATLNGCSAALLVAGRVLIARGKMAAHRVAMLTAVATSSLFLISYLYYHYHVGSVHFRGTGWTRPLYFAILISH